MRLFWNEHTWKEVQQNLPEIVLLPIGSVEAHGPHLPLATDTIISEEIAQRAARELKKQNIHTLILPTINYVITDFSRDFQGTISIRKPSFHALLHDIAGSLSTQGIRKLCIVNSHLEPDHINAIHEFAATCTTLTVLFPDKTKKPWATRLTAEFKQGACHAGCYETSLVMATRPELVREERKQLSPNQVNLAILMREGIRTFREAGAPDAYFGDPAAATTEEGETTYAILTEMVVQTILDHLRA